MGNNLLGGIMPLPTLTHLQFLVLGALLSGEMSGVQLRETLKNEGVNKSLASFYQLMARLEEGGHVEGRYEQEMIDGIPVKERVYTATGHGVRTWEETREFYFAKGSLGLRGA